MALRIAAQRLQQTSTGVDRLSAGNLVKAHPNLRRNTFFNPLVWYHEGVPSHIYNGHFRVRNIPPHILKKLYDDPYGNIAIGLQEQGFWNYAHPHDIEHILKHSKPPYEYEDIVTLMILMGMSMITKERLFKYMVCSKHPGYENPFKVHHWVQGQSSIMHDLLMAIWNVAEFEVSMHGEDDPFGTVQSLLMPLMMAYTGCRRGRRIPSVPPYTKRDHLWLPHPLVSTNVSTREFREKVSHISPSDRESEKISLMTELLRRAVPYLYKHGSPDLFHTPYGHKMKITMYL